MKLKKIDNKTKKNSTDILGFESGNYLKQSKIGYAHGSIVNIYIVYKHCLILQIISTVVMVFASMEKVTLLLVILLM